MKSKRKLKPSQVADALGALGHEARLSVFRLLVRAGSNGLLVGELSEHLEMPPSTLAHHLKALVAADLVTQERNGREVLNFPNFEMMRATMAYLTDQCCTGVELKIGAA